MPKNKGGRSKFTGKIQYSPHPAQTLKELRSMGVTENEIRQFRRAVRAYEEVRKDIIMDNIAANVSAHTTAPSYEALKAALEHGKTVKEVAQNLREHRSYYLEHGRSLDVNEAIKGEVDFVNKELTFDFMREEDVDLLGADDFRFLQSDIENLHIYVESRDEAIENHLIDQAQKCQVTIEKILNDIVSIIEEARAGQSSDEV